MYVKWQRASEQTHQPLQCEQAQTQAHLFEFLTQRGIVHFDIVLHDTNIHPYT